MTPSSPMVLAPRTGLARHRWLLLRRVIQLGILLLFLIGPWFGHWLVKGNLNFSETLGVLPLTDPLVLLQSLLAGHAPERRALIGAGLVLFLYLLVGGRAYCAWVCPINPLTDAAAWLRRRLGIKGGAHLSRRTRLWMLAAILLLPMVTGVLAWESINPVSMLHRGLIFGFGLGWSIVLGIFLFDVFIMQRGWCGHVCPVGAFYGLIGHLSLLRVTTPRRSACDDCMDCYAVCPEPQVLRPVLKGRTTEGSAGKDGTLPLILDSDCINCGRCIDVCEKDVFAFGTRFHRTES